MNKSYFILILLLSLGTNPILAQDGVFKFKSIDLSFQEINGNDILESIELFENDIFQSSKGYKSNCKLDSLTHIYELRYSYSGIGGGQVDNQMPCPQLMLKLSFKTEEGKAYIRQIPIILSICSDAKIYRLKVLNIDLNSLIQEKDKMIEIIGYNMYKTVDKKKIEMDNLKRIE